MKFIHLSDLHLGIRFRELSLLEDQRFILDRILELINTEKPDCIVIAGDVYDKTYAPAEAVALLDDFLWKLKTTGAEILIISGNHDSPERLSFGSRIMNECGIHISRTYSGADEPVVLSDDNGTVNFWLLPFVRPGNVRRFFPDTEINTYTDAVKAAIGGMKEKGLDFSERNVIVTHQFVTGASISGSEEITVGGTDNVEASAFDGFDYVALGHIHGAQNVSGDERIRYCGTPLKYSFSEVSQKKSATIVELGRKGELTVRTAPLEPVRDMREIKGKFDDIMSKDFYSLQKRDDYLHIILTDEDDVPDAMARLRVVYENVMKLDYDNTRTRSSFSVHDLSDAEKKSPMALFEEFYAMRTNSELEPEQRELIEKLLDEIEEELQ